LCVAVPSAERVVCFSSVRRCYGPLGFFCYCTLSFPLPFPLSAVCVWQRMGFWRKFFCCTAWDRGSLCSWGLPVLVWRRGRLLSAYFPQEPLRVENTSRVAGFRPVEYNLWLSGDCFFSTGGPSKDCISQMSARGSLSCLSSGTPVGACARLFVWGYLSAAQMLFLVSWLSRFFVSGRLWAFRLSYSALACFGGRVWTYPLRLRDAAGRGVLCLTPYLFPPFSCHAVLVQTVCFIGWCGGGFGRVVWRNVVS